MKLKRSALNLNKIKFKYCNPINCPTASTSHPAEYAFGAGLNNHERAIVHDLCKKFGFTSKSFGKGDNRAVTVFKRRLRGEDANPIFELPLGDASLKSLDKYFSSHPPTQLELAQAAGGPEHDAPLSSAYGIAAPTDTHASNKNSRGGNKGGNSHAVGFSSEEIAQRQKKWEKNISRPDMKSIIEGREKLPIAAYRDEIVSAVRENQVVLIAGETGCGKPPRCLNISLKTAGTREKGAELYAPSPEEFPLFL